MKILLVSGPQISLKEPYNSGIEAFIISLATELVEKGHSVDVIAGEAQYDSGFTLINPFSPKRIQRMEFLDRFRERREFKMLDFSRYDIIHFNMFYPHLLEIGSKSKKPIVVTLHSPVDKRRLETYKKYTRRKQISFVAISKRIKYRWDKALNLDLPLISNGVNTNTWTPWIRSGKYLFWSARINKEKNVEAAIQLANYMNLPLKIAGRISDLHYFNKNVKPHLNDQIEYVGHVSQRDLNNLAKHAFAYLATATWHEPFGLASLEMLASGVPVVGFESAVPSDLRHESVLTTTSSNWRDLVDLVKKSSSISSASCKQFASNMTIEDMTTGYEILYNEKVTAKDNDQPEPLVKKKRHSL